MTTAIIIICIITLMILIIYASVRINKNVTMPQYTKTTNDKLTNHDKNLILECIRDINEIFVNYMFEKYHATPYMNMNSSITFIHIDTFQPPTEGVSIKIGDKFLTTFTYNDGRATMIDNTAYEKEPFIYKPHQASLEYAIGKLKYIIETYVKENIKTIEFMTTKSEKITDDTKVELTPLFESDIQAGMKLIIKTV